MRVLLAVSPTRDLHDARKYRIRNTSDRPIYTHV